MVISIVLLGVLFLAGLINLFFHFPTKKLYAWVDQYFFPKNNKISSTTTTTSPAASAAAGGPNNKAEIKKVFATFDKNGDGFITKQELIESLKNIRFLITEKEVEEMVVKVDANGDGLIDLDEFYMLCKSSMVNGTEDDKGGGGGGGTGEDEDLKEAFDVFDKDKDGLISVEELGFVLSSLGLKEGKKVEDCKEMIRKVDLDGDGMVNFDEFKRMMKTGGTLLLAAS